jgi:thiamine pyrophosphate-dependent acetolactate synthase large subunit-like protein
VADVVAGALRHARVERVFVAAGADRTLVDATGAAGLAIVPVSAAASACLMAAVTGTLGDAPGAALVGDAAAAALDSLAAARRDRAPAVVIASQACPRGAPVKSSVEVRAHCAAHDAARAVHAAMEEPPGPVWLAVDPAIVRRGAGPVTEAPRPVRALVDAGQVDAVAARLATCARPVVVAGRECRAPGAAGWLRAFAESLPAPVLVTPAARGALPDPHPLAFGVLRADAALLARADLVVALGVDGLELEAARVTLPEPVLRLGRGAGAEGPAAVVAEGEVPALLEELASRLRDRVRADWDVAELERLRRAIPAPAVEPALAALVTRARDATPAGTAAVFARALEALTPLWPAVGPGALIVADAPLAAATALALARRPHAALAFAAGDAVSVAEVTTAVAAGVPVIALVVGGPAIDEAGVRAAGARIVRPLSPAALAVALEGALDGTRPTVIALPRAG